MSPNGPEGVPKAIVNFQVTTLTGATIYVQGTYDKRQENARRKAREQEDREGNDARRRAMGDIDDDASLMGGREAEEGSRRRQ
ncbi:uncharacterized protein ALTATR162_LOCUS468 [Alternaria atra]|uniref:Uncharacterized protein n=1 Tax=Alternaria atra TaxID=119953 RepID=A0A8J2HVD8_9PLEO|nr:uncharacterized protein ALTATR162_LOCUS468 [Alternaria atra]CAG5139338.1 unnamed protein product [Alternaria atra]